MKQIILRDGEKHPHRKLLEEILGLSPVKAMTVKEVMRRGVMLEALAEAKDRLVVEDADYELLKAAVEEWPWAKAHPEIARFIEDVLEAKPPPAH